MHWRGIAAAAVTLLAGAMPVPASAATATERISMSAAGGASNGVSSAPVLSADGRFVAFVSSASNIVPGDINGQEVFVRDRATGRTVRAASDALGNQALRASVHPAISADGRYVAFESIAPNLVPGDTNGREDIFVKDLATGTIERESVTSTGKQALASSGKPAISDDGRFVAFESSASLVPDDTNRSGDAGSDGDVFVRDRVANTTVRVSVDSAGHEVADGSGLPTISGDGRYVGFESRVPGLVAGDTNGMGDAFVHDRLTGATERVSISTSGQEANGNSGPPQLSGDGRWAVFASDASNLVPGDVNGTRDVFARDRVTGRTIRVSTDLSGGDANGPSDAPTISRDGRVVAFTSAASDLVAGDGNGAWDSFIRELASGTTRRASVDGSGTEGNGPSSDPAVGAADLSLSADGRFAGFASDASNLVPGDGNGLRDVFVRQDPFPPSVLAAPRIAGSAVVGQLLTGTPGSWAGTPPIAFAYQWQRCDSVGAACVNIAGATATTYRLDMIDVGHTIRLRVRATNDATAVWRTTTVTKPVAAG